QKVNKNSKLARGNTKYQHFSWHPRVYASNCSSELFSSLHYLSSCIRSLPQVLTTVGLESLYCRLDCSFLQGGQSSLYPSESELLLRSFWLGNRAPDGFPEWHDRRLPLERKLLEEL